jgi:signal transduction histidine kinase
VNAVNSPLSKKERKYSVLDDQVQILNQHLESAFCIFQRFLQSETEVEIIRSLLQELSLLFSSFGASYIPFDDQKSPQIYYRNEPGISYNKIQSWFSYLSAPSVRSQCRICQKDEPDFQICPLLNNPFTTEVKIFCFRIMLGKSKIGVLTLYLPPLSPIQSIATNFIHNIAEITAKSIELRRKYSLEETRKDPSPGENQISGNSIEYSHEIDLILKERSRLAREYHDGIAQMLAFVKIQLAQMDGFIKTKNFEDLSKTISLSYQAVSEAYIDVREAIDDLHKNPMEGSFLNWLQGLAARFFSNFDIAFNIMDFPEKPDIPNEAQLHLTRIIQEALSNIRKHSRARNVNLVYYEESNFAIIEIMDDGIGFNPNEDVISNQHGLVSMKERAGLINADLSITSQLNYGTTIRLRIPQNDKK